MTRLPPYVVRRFVIAPALVLGMVLAATALPIWVIVAGVASHYVPGRWRPLRVAWFLMVYLVLEVVMLAVLLALWVASGFGWKLRSARFESAHYAVAGWWLRRVMGSARRTFKVRIDRENPDEVVPTDRPALVFSRHAGPGDSFLLVDAVLNQRRRRPRIVLKDLLQVDPTVDVLLNRLPTRFVPSSGRAGDAVVESIAELAAGMGPRDALVLFPEGGNFTPRRRERAIEQLETTGRTGLADRAREMRHLLPPKPTGALAALAAAPEADVVFVGHVGLERLTTLGDLWRGIPMDSHVIARVWTVPAADVPDPPEREAWLYDRWQVIDDWIAATLESQAATQG